MTVSRSTPAFDRVAQMAREIAGTYKLTVVGLSASATDKLAGLARTGRPFLLPTQALGQAAARYMRAELLRNANATAADMLDAAAQGVRAQVLLRWTAQGNDIALRPLTPGYRASKARLGLDGRIGIARGSLLAELGRARWTFTRS